ncbi:DNA-repair protein [Methylobacterium aquaticum]|uniref:DNA-repair protein n=1 Tax=Methylobacterium aquaticum TaxID=270351 RepID=A0A1Y0Z8P7_9HYPH|nr:DNA-repair protein [Methylobacterium aquaticum]
MAAHATRLGEKLRRDGLAVSAVTVFSHTSEHDRSDPMRSVSTVVHLPEATNDSCHLIQAALHGVAKTWKEQGPTALALQQGRAGHEGSRAARRGTSPAVRRPRPGEVRGADGGDGHLQQPVRAWRRGAGAGGAGREAHLVDEVRDALAAVHDAVERGAECVGAVGAAETAAPSHLAAAPLSIGSPSVLSTLAVL